MDHAGRPIRPDVRLAAHEIWKHACQRTQTVLSDHAPAAELMETAVAQVSRYLDRKGALHSSPKHGLLTVAFCRGLRRYAAKLSRLEPIGGWMEFSNQAAAENWIEKVNARLDLENTVRKLSERNGFVLMLRAAGFEWKEIARILGTSPAALRNSFWRELAKLRVLP